MWRKDCAEDPNVIVIPIQDILKVSNFYTQLHSQEIN